ncbi:hypothetical protein ACWGKR_30730 [Bacillus thuringiensis]|uniref:Uncharacterized protein n=1 Tax=Bacillus wiedmannii TaxID=1890302 RepID=A0A242YZU9_9BACI|nr:hypothetical protein [Bacillus thuringiensis]OTX84810.1 hypothetical protein BK730_23830 [Bacillus wiedmannii]OTZ80612.1 hypothetical protein BK771_32615 [Bacillus thuringiensis serovar ostriniae]PFA93093.1 hypothetical protein CN393_01995 [Bacillus cereus]MBG9782042.1 hypothetical protein [Bacillus thuringiensis]
MFDQKYVTNIKRSIIFGWFVYSFFIIFLGYLLGGYYIFLGLLILTIRYLALPIYIPHDFKLDPSFIISYFHSLIHRHSFFGLVKYGVNILIILAGIVSLIISSFTATTILLVYETFYLFHVLKTNRKNL